MNMQILSFKEVCRYFNPATENEFVLIDALKEAIYQVEAFEKVLEDNFIENNPESLNDFLNAD